MNVNIIIPVHNPHKKLIEEIERRIQEQTFKGSVKIIKIRGLGLANAINEGIKKSDTDIVVTLHQDCVPSTKDWLENLIIPLKNKEVVASVSRVELPFKFWEKFDFLGKIMSAKEQRIITPLLDEKGCAYRRNSILKVGMFNGKMFRTAGEDFDMYLKLKSLGKISYPSGAKVYHMHRHSAKQRIKKERQLSEGFGVLFRTYGRKVPSWEIGIVKAIPFVGWSLSFLNTPFRKIGFRGLIIWVYLSLIVSLIYSFGFWKGFLTRRQRY